MEKLLFSRNKKGKIIVWKISLTEYKDKTTISIARGTYGGKKAVSFEHITEGVNIGKANETSIEEQAFNRANSRIEKKKKEGYVEVRPSLENAVSYNESIKTLELLEEDVPQQKTDVDDFIKPMLASQYFKSKKESIKGFSNRKYYFMANPYKAEEKDININFPCLLQPKIDGVRATISFKNEEVIIKSREGNKYTNLPHIEDMFKKITNEEVQFNGHIIKIKDLVFDGELYIHNHTLQEIVSAVKATNIKTPFIGFYCYDLAIDTLGNLERFKLLKKINNIVKESMFSLVRTFKVFNNKQVQNYTIKVISLGYEGSIARTINAKYKFGSRTKDLCKIKRVISEDYKIVDIIPQKIDKSLGLLICKTGNKTFKVNPSFNEQNKKDLLTHKSTFINSIITLKFHGYTKDKLPFHIIETIIRNYE